jgi:hypothetical protein
VRLGVGGCRPGPVAPATISLSLDGTPLGTVPACPPRQIALLLPPRRAQLQIDSPAWQPSEAGIERAGPLGVYLSRAEARAEATSLSLRASPVPIPPMPAGVSSLRRWISDYRYGHWDVWPWYLAHSGLPAGPALTLGAVWAGMALALTVVGGLLLRQVTTKKE